MTYLTSKLKPSVNVFINSFKLPKLFRFLTLGTFLTNDKIVAEALNIFPVGVTTAAHIQNDACICHYVRIANAPVCIRHVGASVQPEEDTRDSPTVDSQPVRLVNSVCVSKELFIR